DRQRVGIAQVDDGMEISLVPGPGGEREHRPALLDENVVVFALDARDAPVPVLEHARAHALVDEAVRAAGRGRKREHGAGGERRGVLARPGGGGKGWGHGHFLSFGLRDYRAIRSTAGRRSPRGDVVRRRRRTWLRPARPRP